jgi:two-component system, OmpR family, response regulator VicR
MTKRILLVEDEKKLSLIIKETLALYDFEVIVAYDGIEGLKFFSELKPGLVIIDIMMPKMDGFQVLGHIRRLDVSVPVIVLTAKLQTIDLVKAFELGCNDYIKKPFIMDELLVRVRALLSGGHLLNKGTGEKNIIRIGQFIFNVTTQELRGPSRVHSLSFKETEILKRLCQHPNLILDRKRVLLELWGDDNIFNSKTLNVYITKLRNYFKEDPGVQILNLRSIGYKLVLRADNMY